MTDKALELAKEAMVSAETEPTPEIHGDNEKKKQENQASALVTFCQDRLLLFHDSNNETYAQDNVTGETRQLGSIAFRDWITATFFLVTGKAVRDQSLREALNTLGGLARHQGECHEVHIRVAGKDGIYYLDLGEPDKDRAIKISAAGWEIVEKPPVRFIRPETMRPLPVPEHGGLISSLWRIANIPENARLLVLAWLGECLRPDTPFPVLEIIGEHGTAKSTTQTAIRRLIDPNACDLRAKPKSPDDIFVGAGVSLVVSYENVSYLSAVMQDALCVISTGAGFATRRFYTNTEECVIAVKRPVVINGIAATVTAQDLVDRTISIEVPVLRERYETTILWQQYEKERPKLLGAFLNLVVHTLQKLPMIDIPQHKRPRLIEFARFGMAMAEALGFPSEKFMEQFTVARGNALERTIDASPVATAIREWIALHPNGSLDTAKALMSMMDGLKPPYGEGWPRTPKGFADAMRRAAPALRQLGIDCRSLPKKGGLIKWEIRTATTEQCPASPESLDPVDGGCLMAGHKGHAGHDPTSFVAAPPNNDEFTEVPL